MKLCFILIFSCFAVLAMAFDPHNLWVSPEKTYQVYEDIEKALVKPSAVKALRLKNAGLKNIPAEIAEFKELEILQLQNNAIKLTQNDLKILENLSSLRSLVLTNNNIEVISPEFIDALPAHALEALVLDKNMINGLPSNLHQLKNLEILELGANDFNAFPEEVVKLQNLIYLGMIANKLSRLSADFSDIDEMETMNFGGNDLKRVEILLPESIVVVSFAANKLENIQGNFSDCPNLKLLNLSRNPNLRLPGSLIQLKEKNVVRLSEK